MRNRALFITLTFLLLATTALAAAKNVSSGEVLAMLAKGSKVYLLDVRTPDEYRQAHLRGAVLLPLNDLQLRYYEIPRDKTIVVYCAVGSRSGVAANFLANKGYKTVYNMADGIVGWYRSGYPLDR